jgi:glutamate dehydrogenase
MPANEQDRTDAVQHAVTRGLDAAAEAVVPWFMRTMPEYYFRTHSQPEQVRHLQAIISGQVTTENQTITLRSP